MATPEFILELRSKIGNDLLEVPTVCGVVFDDAGKVLCMRHSEGGRWSLPGGMIEPCESPSDAAVREVFEETGIHMRITGVVGVFGGPAFVVTFANGDKLSFVMTAFRGERIGGELRVDGDESLEVGYFNREDLATMDCSHIVAAVLDVVSPHSQSTWFPQTLWQPPD